MRKNLGFAAAVIAATALMNVVRVDRTNRPEDPAESMESQTQMPGKVRAIFRRACQNCHSERTEWPWYSAAAPIHWLMAADVYAAREHLNLSTWRRYNEERRTASLIAICEMVASDKMPLWYYKPAHYPSAWLSESEKKAVCDWTKAEFQSSTAMQDLSSGGKEIGK